MSDFTGVLIVFLFVVIAFVSAMRHGVVKLLSSGAAAAASLAVLVAGVHFLPVLAKTFVGIELTWKVTAALSAAGALLVYIICRIIGGMIFSRMFNRDGWFHSLVDGIPGGIISLFPSAVVVFFLFTCIRMAGTLQELNYVDSLAQEAIIEMGGRIPAYPFSSSWRSGVESIPGVAEVLDWCDPFSNRKNRNAAAFVLASKSTYLKVALLDHPDTMKLMGREGWAELAADPAISDAVRKFDRVGLVLAPAIQRAAGDPVVGAELKSLNLRAALADFAGSIVPMTPAAPAPQI